LSSERSDESVSPGTEIHRCAQNDIPDFGRQSSLFLRLTDPHYEWYQYFFVYTLITPTPAVLANYEIFPMTERFLGGYTYTMAEWVKKVKLDTPILTAWSRNAGVSEFLSRESWPDISLYL
jgi:hypothetical protein